MFQKFTEKSIKVIMLAQAENRRLNHNFVDSDQILLGLIGEGNGIAAQALKSTGVGLEDARLAAENKFGRGSGNVSIEMPFTDDAKRVLESSWDGTEKLYRSEIDTEHLLLAILRQKNCGAAGLLQTLDIDLAELENRVRELIKERDQKSPGYNH